MDPVIGGLVSGVVGGLFGKSNAKNQHNQQKEMMQNAHQWEVADLRKAGLNPILSGTGGSGAGSFNAPSVDTPNMDLASAAAAKAQIKIAKQNADSNAKNADTQRDVGLSTINSNTANANLASANALYARANTLKAEIEANNLKDFLPRLYEAQIENQKAQATGFLAQSSAAAYNLYEQGLKASKERELTDFTLKSDLKYGSKGIGGWLSKFSDDVGGNLSSSASGGNWVDNLESKFRAWTRDVQSRYNN